MTDTDASTLLERAQQLKKMKIYEQKRLEQEAQIRKEQEENALEGYRPKRPTKAGYPSDLQKKLDAIDAQLRKAENDISIRDCSKTVSLGTSKVNYIDPRIIVSWCKENSVQVTKVFAKTLINKFPWAMDSDNYTFEWDSTQERQYLEYHKPALDAKPKEKPLRSPRPKQASKEPSEPKPKRAKMADSSKGAPTSPKKAKEAAPDSDSDSSSSDDSSSSGSSSSSSSSDSSSSSS